MAHYLIGDICSYNPSVRGDPLYLNVISIVSSSNPAKLVFK